MRRRVAIAFVLCATVCVLVVAEAAAAGPFKACAPGSPLLCARITVPLDRSGATPGTVNLHVERLRSRGPREGALLALAGGPGEAATPYVFDWAFTLRSALQNRDLVVLDQRGTGLSGVLRCRSLFVPVTRTPLEQAQAAERCAQSLGPRRAHYTTRDSVDDIDAVRRAVGVDKITLFGVSYGTKVALGYAAKYPQHVERLVLDSVVEPTGPGAFSQESLAAVPRILRTLCVRGCEEITQGPAGRSRGAAVLDARGFAVRAAGRRGRPAQARPDRPAAAPGAVVRRGLRPHSARRAARRPAGGARGRHGAVAAARPAKRAGSGPDARPLSERRAVHGDRMRGGTAAVGSHDTGECTAQPWPRRTSGRCRPRPSGPSTAPRCCSDLPPSSSAAAGPPRPPSHSCPTAPSPPCPRSCLRARTTCAPRSSPRAGSRRGSRGRRWSPCPRWVTRC